MAEAHDGETIKAETKDEAPDIESKIKVAMRSRVRHFKEQADSLTFEGVRRLLEKDLELETYALDVHKRYVKQCLLQCLETVSDDNVSKNSTETVENDVCSTKGEGTKLHDNPSPKKDLKEPSTEGDAKMEDSPVLGLMTGHKTTKSETVETQVNEDKEELSESKILKAMKKRGMYFKANSEKVTMAGVRRLLEEDLELDKNTLDSYKKFISEQLDKVLKSLQVSESATVVKKKSLKKNSHSKASKHVSSDEGSDSSGSESEEVEDEVKPKKRAAPKAKTKNSDVQKKRKRPENGTKVSNKKRIKDADTATEDNSDADDDGNVSEEHSQSSAEKPVKKKDVSTPAYGKRAENLKSVIKSCGMSVPPSIYRKVKQAPEHKREACLIKELEGILSKEGLSANPSEKDIKDVRKRKERAKELEGIDMSNIVSSTRRRSTTSFVPPPKPKITVESDDDDSEDSDDGSDSDDENDENDDENDDVDDNDGGNGSQSEELNEDKDEDSD